MLNNLFFATTFHYGTIEQAVFSLLLFFFFLTVYSFLATNGFASIQTAKEEFEEIDQFVKQVQEAFAVEPESRLIVKPLPKSVISDLQPTTEKKEGGLITEDPKLKLTTNEEIESFVSTLKVRQARKVAKALDIRQKVNKKDKSLEQFKREIRQALRKQSQLLIKAQEAVKAA